MQLQYTLTLLLSFQKGSDSKKWIEGYLSGAVIRNHLSIVSNNMHPQQNNPSFNTPSSGNKQPPNQPLQHSHHSSQQSNPSQGHSHSSNLSQLPPRKPGSYSAQTGTNSKDMRPIYESRFNLLPRTQDFKEVIKTDGKIVKGNFLTNYYHFNDVEIAQVFVYQVQVYPTIPADSSEKWYRLIRSMKKKLEKQIGMITFRGNTVWAQFRKPNFITNTTLGGPRRAMPGQPPAPFQPLQKYEVAVAGTGRIPMKDLCADKNEKIKPLYIQMINSKIKEKLQELNFVELGNGRFYSQERVAEKEKVNMPSVGLNVLNGYRFTVTCLAPTKTYLQIDSCSRILRTSNFLQQLDRIQGGSTEKNNFFKGAIVVARYGKYKTYNIESIEFNMSPSSTFPLKVEGKEQEVSYATYYERCYNIKVKTAQQPMIRAIAKVEKKIRKGNKFTKTENAIFLIPELLSLTGMSEQLRSNYKVMSEVAKLTRQEPTQRFMSCEQLIRAIKLRQKNPVQIGNAVLMEGYRLKQPVIKIGGKTITADVNGNFDVKQPILQQLNLKPNSWIMVSSNYTTQQDADYFLSMMRECGVCYDISIGEPCAIRVQYATKQDAQVWITAIGDCVSKLYAKLRPQIIVLVLQDLEVNLYNAIKKFCSKEIKIFTQFFLASSLSSEQKGKSAASKIILQMAAKVGRTLWTVQPQHSYWDNKFVATASVCYSRGLRNSYTVGMVGTSNPEQTSVYTYCMVGLSKREQVPMQIYCNFFEKWLSRYLSCAGKLPDTIIVYRQGLSEAQIKRSVGEELEQLYAVIEQKIRKAVPGYKDYNPEVVYMTVNKKVNSKFYDYGKNKETGKPFACNPESGSVIFCEMASNNQIDFYLTPLRVLSGTATPSQYRIIYYNGQNQALSMEKKSGGVIPEENKTVLPLHALAQYTYEQCFNYYNWQGAVRVPSVMQNANKLCKLVGEHIQANMNYVDFENTYRGYLMQMEGSGEEKNKKLQVEREKFQRILCSLYFL